MGKTPVADGGQAAAGHPAAAGGYATQKKGIPLRHGGQLITGGRKCPRTESAKKDIILKKQDRLRSGGKALVQATDMRLKDSLFPVFRMWIDQDKFHPVQEADGGKLLLYLFAPISPIMQGNTVDPVKEIPAPALIPAALIHLSIPFLLARGPGYRVQYNSIHPVAQSSLAKEYADDPTVYPVACQERICPPGHG